VPKLHVHELSHRRRGGGGGGSPERTRKCVSRLGSGLDRDGKIEGDTGNQTRAKEGSEIGRGNGAMASGGSGTPASSCGHGSAGGRERDGREASSPPRGAPGVVDRRRAAAERRRSGGLRCERQRRRRRARLLGF
jgi:hypothetical protein